MAETTPHPPSAPAESHPTSEFEHEGRLKIVIAGLDQNRRAEAIEAANAALNAKLTEGGGGGFKDFLKHTFTLKLKEAGKDARAMGRRVRYGNLGREHYIYKGTKEAERRIEETGDVYTFDELADEDYKVQTTMRFAHEYDDLIHEEAGERRTKLDFESDAEGNIDTEAHELKARIFRLIERFAADEFGSEDDFNEEKKRIITEAVNDGLLKEHVSASLLYADNLLQIATHVKAAIESRKAAGEDYNIDTIMANTDIVLGEARTGARTEIKQNAVERINEKLNKYFWFNEATMGTAVSIGYSVGSWAVKRGVGKVIGAVAAPGMAGGIWAGMRENARMKEERVQHAREAAEGKLDRDNLTGRREKLDATIYETKSAQELLGQIGVLYNEDGELRIDSQESFTEAMFMVAEAQARIRLSDQRKIDLISFSEVGKIEKERFELDLALAKAKVDLRKFIDGKTDDELKALGLGDLTIAEMRKPDTDSLDFLLEPNIEGVQGVYEMAVQRLENGDEAAGEEGMKIKDRLFNKLRAKEVAKAIAKGTIIGAVIGMFAQEVSAEATGSREGILENQPNAAHETALRGAWETVRSVFGERSHEGGGTTLNADPSNTLQIGEGTKFMLPEGFKVDHTPGSSEIHVTGHGVNETLHVSKDGTLDQASLDKLHQAGFVLGAPEHGVVSQDVAHETNSSAADFLKNNPDGTTHVTRDFWYDNDSPNIYDHNELGLWDPQHHADGSVSLHINMTEHGSEHNGQLAHWQELAKQGKLKIALSLSKGTQSQVYMVNVDEHGNAVIPADSPLAKLFSEGLDERGRPQFQFNGQYTEVVETHGVDANGVEHIRPLATDVGRHHATFPDTVHTKEVTPTNTYKIDFHQAAPVEREQDVLVAPTVPVYGRRGLEPVPERGSLPPRDLEAFDYYGYYNGSRTLESLQKWIKANPEILKPRRKIKRADGSEAWVEADGSPVVRDVARERETLTNYVDGIRQRDPDYYNYLLSLEATTGMDEMDPRCRVSVNIPAWMEEKHIYDLLRMYTEQTDRQGKLVDPESYEINVIVNRKTGTDPDNTVAEIQRFLAETGALDSGYKINFIDVEFDPPLNNVGNARRVVTDLTLLRSLRRPTQDGSLYIETEDADILRLDQHTIHNIVDKMDGNPHLDAVRGLGDRAPWYLQENDFVFLERRIWDFMEGFARGHHYRPENNPNWNQRWNRNVTGGWNSAYSAEAYALIGGYEPTVMGEDTIIGEKISMIRGNGTTPNIDTIGKVASRSDGSPRRFIAEVLTGRGAYSDAFGDPDFNKFVKEASIEDLLDGIKDYSRINAHNVPEFAQLVQSRYDWAKNMTPDLEAAAGMYTRVLAMAGFKKGDYQFSPDKQSVTILNWNNAAQALNDYRTRHPQPERSVVTAPAVTHTPLPSPVTVPPTPTPAQAIPATAPAPAPSPVPPTPVPAPTAPLPIDADATVEFPAFRDDDTVVIPRIDGSEPPTPEIRAALNSIEGGLEHTPAGYAGSIITDNLTVDGMEANGRFRFEGIDPTDGWLVFYQLTDNAGRPVPTERAVQITLPREEVARLMTTRQLVITNPVGAPAAAAA